MVYRQELLCRGKNRLACELIQYEQVTSVLAHGSTYYHKRNRKARAKQLFSLYIAGYSKISTLYPYTCTYRNIHRITDIILASKIQILSFQRPYDPSVQSEHTNSGMYVFRYPFSNSTDCQVLHSSLLRILHERRPNSTDMRVCKEVLPHSLSTVDFYLAQQHCLFQGASMCMLKVFVKYIT